MFEYCKELKVHCSEKKVCLHCYVIPLSYQYINGLKNHCNIIYRSHYFVEDKSLW